MSQLRNSVSTKIATLTTFMCEYSEIDAALAVQVPLRVKLSCVVV